MDVKQKFSHLNDMQQEAVFAVEGPVLILAGAGSGKTTVLVNRVAYMVERGIKPRNILAITFTNKAANELKDRLRKTVGDDAAAITAGTFHSVCARILRMEIAALGYERSFTIYDTDDSVRVIRECLSELSLDDKKFVPKQILGTISRAKDRMLTAKEFAAESGSDYYYAEAAKVFARYEKKLSGANALDFDDLICKTVELFRRFPDVLGEYRNRFRYILVDEYQDTNHVQYMLVSLLSSEHQNLCVVGDDDQSIYKFRGATIENILNFEQQFKNAKVIRLEQNYRSTGTILDAANAVISNNKSRKGKKLWTSLEPGEKIKKIKVNDENEEAGYITDCITSNKRKGMSFSSHAVLYRINAQSAEIERNMIRAGIPYRIFGGTKFYDRKEIRDIIAYLSVINNHNDNVRLRRIINEPKRGIGETTIDTLFSMTESMGISAFDILKQSDTYPALQKKSGTLMKFVSMIDELTEADVPLAELIEMIMELTGYTAYLMTQGVQGQVRLENILELKTAVRKYEAANESPSLAGFLEEVALYTDIDTFNADDDCVVMMTIHSSKGLEFPCVFIAGMEEGIFPSQQSSQQISDLEEERRLAYVGITRAKQQLYLMGASRRMIFGSTRMGKTSRFIDEIPEELYELHDTTAAVQFIRVQRESGFSFGPNNRRTINPSAKKKAEINYSVGDTVTHAVFGAGKVVTMTPMAGDMLVEVDFERVGAKKLMANFGKLEKL
ncbi:MAG: UvrD-helicase domain-containing protein [Oscillospiraceae bacterium]|nr:UvrD-helicase domain-containing protein [Oscillospiraceae bacterium]